MLHSHQTGGLLVATPEAICHGIEQIWVLGLSDGSEFGEVLGYVAFERAR